MSAHAGGARVTPSEHLCLSQEKCVCVRVCAEGGGGGVSQCGGWRARRRVGLPVTLSCCAVGTLGWLQLGSMYADDYLSDNRNSAIDTAIGFGVLWLTWHHVNMLYTRFALEDVWNVAEYFIMVRAPHPPPHPHTHGASSSRQITSCAGSCTSTSLPLLAPFPPSHSVPRARAKEREREREKRGGRGARASILASDKGASTEQHARSHAHTHSCVCPSAPSGVAR